MCVCVCVCVCVCAWVCKSIHVCMHVSTSKEKHLLCSLSDGQLGVIAMLKAVVVIDSGGTLRDEVFRHAGTATHCAVQLQLVQLTHHIAYGGGGSSRLENVPC